MEKRVSSHEKGCEVHLRERQIKAGLKREVEKAGGLALKFISPGTGREYLDILLPENWYELSIYDRRDFIKRDDFAGELTGTMQRQRVCTLEIWCELFGKEPSTMKRQDSYELNGIMRKIEGWERYTDNKIGNAKVPGYGIQRIFIRKQDGEQTR